MVLFLILKRRLYQELNHLEGQTVMDEPLDGVTIFNLFCLTTGIIID
jgi:hypothetical protein